MDLIVLEEIDKNNISTFIGVAETLDVANAMLQNYCGTYKLVDNRYVGESGLECVYEIEVDNEIYTIVFRCFQLNSI